MNSPPPTPGDLFAAESWPLRDLTLPKVLHRNALQHPDKVLLHELAMGWALTYRDMNAWSDQGADALRDAGVAHGHHVSISTPTENSAEHVAVFFSIGKLGAVSVPVNTAARDELLRYYLSQSECTAAVVDVSLCGRLWEVLGDLPLLKRIFIVGGPERAAAGKLGEVGAVEVHDFDAEVRAVGEAKSHVDVQSHEMLMLAFTSGTTGPSKASMLSHAAALTYGTGAAEAQGYRSSDVFYGTAHPANAFRTRRASVDEAVVWIGG